MNTKSAPLEPPLLTPPASNYE